MYCTTKRGCLRFLVLAVGNIIPVAQLRGTTHVIIIGAFEQNRFANFKHQSAKIWYSNQVFQISGALARLCVP
jgi:hypothetical protein